MPHYPSVRHPPTPQERLRPFDSNGAAFAAGLDLLRNLREMRTGLYAPVKHQEADTLISTFCKRLRASDRSITLAAVQKHAHLLDEAVVVVLAALRHHFTGSGESDIRSALTLAVGFDPARQRRLVKTLQRNCAVHWDESFRLWPNKGMVAFLCGEPIAEQEAIWLKEQIQRLPTVEEERRSANNEQEPESL